MASSPVPDPEPALVDYDVLGSESQLSSLRSSAVIWGLVTLLAVAIIQRARQWYRLRHIPGPFWASISGFWMIRKQWSGKLVNDMTAVCDKHGPVVRVGPNLLLCVDARELRRMWGVRSSWKRSYWLHRGLRLDPSRDNILSESDDIKHNELRAKLINGYGGKEIEKLHEIIDGQVVKFVELIDSKYASAPRFRKMDLGKVAQYFTLDVLATIGFGEPFGYLDADEDLYDYIKTVEQTLPMLVVTSLIPPLLMVLQSPIFKPFLPKGEDVVGLGRMMGITQKIVRERYAKGIVKKDMLGSFIAHGLSQEQAEPEALLQILSGSDTTATAIRATMLYLMATPRAYAKLQAEVDDAVRSGRVSEPVITEAEGKSLPYLQAVIKEGLRVFAPVTGPVPKVSDKDDVICGLHIPAGTDVGWVTFPLMRNKAIFGEDADIFRPERWHEAAGEQLKEMELWQSMCFATGGKWECLGKNIAYIELNKVFFELLKRFDFAIGSPEKPWESYGAGIHILKNFDVAVSRRQITGL